MGGVRAGPSLGHGIAEVVVSLPCFGCADRRWTDGDDEVSCEASQREQGTHLCALYGSGRPLLLGLLLLLFDVCAGELPEMSPCRLVSPTGFHHNHSDGEVKASLPNRQVMLYKRLRVSEYMYEMVLVMY